VLVTGLGFPELGLQDEAVLAHVPVARREAVVAVSPNGRLLASGSYDRTVRLWRLPSGDALAALHGHGNSVMSVAFSPDGSTLASASFDGTLRLWGVASRRCLAVLLPLPEGWVAFTPDGHRYRLGGNLAGGFWYAVNLCRFEPGELDPYLPAFHHLADDEPLLPGLPAPPPRPRRVT
jgi:hypothetical protein